MKNLFFIVFLIASVTIAVPNVLALENSAASSAALLKLVSNKTADGRTKILKEFLTQHNSPLVDSVNTFIDAADKYNLDWKLVASIAGVESTFGKYIPYNSYNGWGWGVYGNNVIYFSSWKEGIEAVSKGLKEGYIDKGATDIYQIGRIYAESKAWPYKVSYFMEKIDEFKSQNEINNLSISL